MKLHQGGTELKIRPWDYDARPCGESRAKEGTSWEERVLRVVNRSQSASQINEPGKIDGTRTSRESARAESSWIEQNRAQRGAWRYGLGNLRIRSNAFAFTNGLGRVWGWSLWESIVRKYLLVQLEKPRAARRSIDFVVRRQTLRRRRRTCYKTNCPNLSDIPDAASMAKWVARKSKLRAGISIVGMIYAGRSGDRLGAVFNANCKWRRIR